MPRAKVVHSEQACHVILEGDKSHPEPVTVVVQFPGGQVEVSRCSNNKDYWMHFHLDEGTTVVDSRQAYAHKTYTKRLSSGLNPIHELEDACDITQIALKLRR